MSLAIVVWPFVKLWSLPGWVWAAAFMFWRVEVVIGAFARSSDEQTAMLRDIRAEMESQRVHQRRPE